MANELRTEVEQVKEQAEVKQALKQTAAVKTERAPKAEAKDKLVLTTHVLILVVLASLHFILQFSFFGFAEKHPRLIDLLQRLDLSAMGVVLVVALAKVADVYWIGRIDSAVSKYNLRRVAKLALGLILVFIVVSGLFQNWYTAVVSVGLIDSAVSKYNLRRVAKLALGLILVFIVVSGLFQNWYTAVVSVGLISLIVWL